MTYMYIHIPILTEDAFIHATREQIGTWLLLYAYCAQHENSGRIKDCKNWAPATWFRICACDTPGESPIWLWHEDDLVLVGYNTDSQRLAQTRRKAGRKGLATRGYNISPKIPRK